MIARCKFGFVAVFILLVTASSLRAESVVLSTDSPPAFNPGTRNQGWWSDTIAQSAGNDNYFAGFLDLGTPNSARGFFTFDLSTVAKPVSAAKLRIRLAGSSSPDLVETIGLFDVSTDAATLNSKGVVDVSIFEDLGTGTTYGSTDVMVGIPEDTILEFPLNAAALADINSQLGSYFSVGASLVSLSDRGVSEYVFGSSQGFANVLELELVPEPASLGILLAGTFLCSALRFRTK